MSQPPAFRVLPVEEYERLTLAEKLAYLSLAFESASLQSEAALSAMSSRPQAPDSEPR